MYSDFRFLVPVTRPSNRHGNGTAVSEKGSGFGAEPKVRIHLPPAESQQTFGPSKWTGPPTSRRFSGAEVVGEFPKPADHNIGRGVGVLQGLAISPGFPPTAP